MHSPPSFDEINSLFVNNDPDKVWAKASAIIRRINPDYDFSLVRSVFDDVLLLFRGEYPGYGSIKTLYHDLSHILDVFLCAVRLMHGVHVSETRLSDKDISLITIAALMHDVGYAQRHDEDTGTGAQYTKEHVARGIKFMQHYALERGFPTDFAAFLAPMIHCTDNSLAFSQVHFPDEHASLLGKIVVTADLTGQMADRAYLEKLLFLYMEFKEAQIGNYQSVQDMLRQTTNFYALTRKKLDCEFDGLYAKLVFHFKETLGVENNYYMESIDKNIAYLSKVITLDEAEYLSMLKRGGIVKKSQTLTAPV